MRLGNFSIEIFVDDEPLQEFSLSKSDHGFITTRPSYIRQNADTAAKQESDHETFVAVPEKGTRYCICVTSYSPPQDPADEFIIKVYVDGLYDGIKRPLTLKNPSYIQKGFYNSEQTQKHYFRFDATRWASRNDSEVATEETRLSTMSTTMSMTYGKITKGGLGAVSVYIFPARTVEKKLEEEPKPDDLGSNKPDRGDSKSTREAERNDDTSTSNKADVNLSVGNQNKIIRSKDANFNGKQATVSRNGRNQDITFLTNFEEIVSALPHSIKYYEKTSKHKLAGIHLHYRSASWLRFKGCNVGGDSNQLILTSDTIGNGSST